MTVRFLSRFTKWFDRFPTTKSNQPRTRSRMILSCAQIEERLVPATFTVNSNFDSGTGTLRQAIIDAQNSLDPVDDIVINPGLTQIYLESQLPLLVGLNSITGNGGVNIGRAPDAVGLFSFFVIPSNQSNTTITVSGINFGIDDGNNITGARAANGGVFDNGGILILNNCRFENNHAVSGSGGSILNRHVLEVTNCWFSLGFAAGHGGAICQEPNSSVAKTTLTNSHFEFNWANGNGGAIALNAGGDGLFSFNSDYLYNTANGNGGAIWIDYLQRLELIDTVTGRFTLSSNYSGGSGGGLCMVIARYALIDATFISNYAFDSGTAGFYISIPQPPLLEGLNINYSRIYDPWEIWNNFGQLIASGEGEEEP